MEDTKLLNFPLARYDVEIEVEEERKFLPTDLFAEGAAGGHEKLSSSKSVVVGGRWDSNTRQTNPSLLSHTPFLACQLFQNNFPQMPPSVGVQAQVIPCASMPEAQINDPWETLKCSS